MASKLRFEVELENLQPGQVQAVENDLLRKLIREAVDDPAALKIEFDKHIKVKVELREADLILTSPDFDGKQIIKTKDLTQIGTILDKSKFSQ